jgi:hypothetical protein
VVVAATVLVAVAFFLPDLVVAALDVLADLAVLLVADFAFAEEVVFFAVAVIVVTELAALGVGVVVQYHLPLANVQAWSSLAVPYSSLWPIALPSGSRSHTWPPLFDMLRPVSME